MPQFPNRLEIRAQKLADAVGRRIDIVSTSLKPQGQRPAFTTLLSQKDAMQWWLKNWDNPMTGGKVLANMDPMSRLELHNAMSQHIESQGLVTPQTGMMDSMSLDIASHFPESQMLAPKDLAQNVPMGPGVG